MTIEKVLIIIISILVGIAYLIYIRSKDIYEKESFFNLFTASLTGGIISVISAFILYGLVNVQHNFTDAVFKIGLIEEFAKFMALILIFIMFKKDFNEIIDGIIYISAISLGFAIIENIFYSFNSDSPFSLLFIRSILSVLGHLLFSIYMGIAFYIHVRIHKNYTGILLSVIISALAHGVFDGIIFHPELHFIINLAYFILFSFQFYLLNTAHCFSEFKPILSSEMFREIENITFLYCSNCDNNTKSKELRFWKVQAGTCNNCGNMVFNTESTVMLFKYFRPLLNFNKLLKNYSKNERIVHLDDDKLIFLNLKRNFLSSSPDNLGKWLEVSNENDRNEILEKPVIGFLFKQLGFKYLIKNNI